MMNQEPSSKALPSMKELEVAYDLDTVTVTVFFIIPTIDDYVC